MVVHICKRCNKIFVRKDNYTRHLNRKIPCKNKNDPIEAKSDKSLIEFLIKKSECGAKDKNSIMNTLELISSAEKYEKNDEIHRSKSGCGKKCGKKFLSISLENIKNPKKVEESNKSDEIGYGKKCGKKIDMCGKKYGKKFGKKCGKKNVLKSGAFLEDNLLKIDDKNLLNNIIINVKNNKFYECNICNKKFKKKRYLDDHLKKYCKNKISNNKFYKFNNSTFGRKLFGIEGGDIYIIQINNNFSDNSFKIGKTTNIYKKLQDYRYNSNFEPRLYFYYSFKNIKKAEKDIKELLLSYKFDDNYKCSLKKLRSIILKYQKLVDNNNTENKPIIKKKDLYDCKFCSKSFNKNELIFKHLSTCKDYQNYFLIPKNKNSYNNLYITKINEKNKEQLEREIEELKEQVDQLKKSQHITNNIIIAYNQQPDLSHLTDMDYLRIMNKGFKSVPKLIEEIHFNPNKPENKNIYIPNIKNKYAMGWNGQKWDLMNRNEVIDDMYDDKSNILIEKFEELESSNIDKNTLNKFRRFINKQDDDDIKNKIKEEIKLLLYNNKNNINK